MGEVLVLGRKRRKARRKGDVRVRFVNLRRRPTSASDAMELARQIRHGRETGTGVMQIVVGDEVVGSTCPAYLGQGGCAGVADLELAEAAIGLEASALKLPTQARRISLCTTRLANLGQRGVVDRDINGTNSDGSYRGPFDLAKISGQPTYPILWEHNAKVERQLILSPDREGRLRTGLKTKGERVWQRASRLHFNRDFQLNSQSLAACVTERPSVGGRAWPNFCLANPAHEAFVTLWANTTLGLLLFWWHGSRQQAGRAIVTVSQLPGLLVADPRALTPAQLAAAEAAFDRFSVQTFRPANEAFDDVVRIALDEEVLIGVLRLPRRVLGPLELVRRKWCAEPSVHGGKVTRIG